MVRSAVDKQRWLWTAVDKPSQGCHTASNAVGQSAVSGPARHLLGAFAVNQRSTATGFSRSVVSGGG